MEATGASSLPLVELRCTLYNTVASSSSWRLQCAPRQSAVKELTANTPQTLRQLHVATPKTSPMSRIVIRHQRALLSRAVFRHAFFVVSLAATLASKPLASSSRIYIQCISSISALTATPRHPIVHLFHNSGCLSVSCLRDFGEEYSMRRLP